MPPRQELLHCIFESYGVQVGSKTQVAKTRFIMAVRLFFSYASGDPHWSSSRPTRTFSGPLKEEWGVGARGGRCMENYTAAEMAQSASQHGELVVTSIIYAVRHGSCSDWYFLNNTVYTRALTLWAVGWLLFGTMWKDIEFDGCFMWYSRSVLPRTPALTLTPTRNP